MELVDNPAQLRSTSTQTAKLYIAGGIAALSASPAQLQEFFDQLLAADFPNQLIAAFDKLKPETQNNPRAIYIRPFCIDTAIFVGDEAASAGEMPIRKALTPVEFAEDLKEELERIAPARILFHLPGLQCPSWNQP